MGSGTPRREFLHVVSRLADLGWRARIDLAEGLKTTYAWYGAESAGVGGKGKGERGKGKGENILMTDHDHGYKRLFSHPEMIRD